VFQLCSRHKIRSGTVTNRDTNHKGVSVYAPELHQKPTDDNGEYILNNLPMESKTNFVFVGFSSQYKIIQKPQKENVLNVMLEETIFEMDEVIVSTAFNKIQSQNVMKVEHESIKSLCKRGRQH
jgi:iron complex outermembrane receptor protein